jgi:20S proteasome alpha/beta subunit
MTLIVALEGPEGIVMAADSRGTIGDPRGLTAINDIQKKLFKLTNHAGISVSGSSELAARLIDTLSAGLPQIDAENVDAILNHSIQVMRQEFTGWFGSKPWAAPQQIIDQRPQVTFILAGFNMRETPPRSRIFLVTSQLDFAPQLCQNGFMLAGIPQYAIYLMHRLYDKQMGLKSLRGLAAYLITETATQDPKVGGPIHMAEITGSKGFCELDDTTIGAILRSNEEQSRKLREFFFKWGAS